jgi:cytochrome c biogenesis protein CcmG, thiol:disulfide interchange protein DsbE
MRPKRAKSVMVAGACVLVAALLIDPSTRAKIHETAYAMGIRRPVAIVSPIAAGEPLPRLDLVGLNGAPAGVAAPSRGTVVYNVFASWCEPCNEEAPFMRAAARRLALRGVRFIGIDRGESSTQAQAFARRYGLPYPVLLDTQESAGILGSRVIPQTIVVRDGIVREIVVGPMDAADLMRIVEGA